MALMDNLIRTLQEKLREHPDNANLKDTLSQLQSLGEHGKVAEDGWDNLQEKIAVLTKDGVSGDEEQKALHEIRAMLHPSEGHTQTPLSTLNGNTEKKGDHPTIIPHLHGHVPRPHLSFASPTALPVELYDLLNQTYSLHVLATDPQSILPPGKSLLSVLSRPHTENMNGVSKLHSQVEGMVHKAFWDEALEALSNPSPAVQLPRLRRLYQDIYEALSSLLPSKHPVLVTLSFPLSPTSSPLRLTIVHLREILQSLRERCAPVRDAHIDDLARALDDPPDASLPQVIVNTARAILKLADVMKDDLSQFVLGSMSERQLRDVVARQAAAREREVVLQLWRPPKLRELWDRWLDETVSDHSDPPQVPRRNKFIRRLMQALGTNHSVSCDLPTITVDVSADGIAHSTTISETQNPPPAPPNPVPPPLLFTTPTLFYIQNYLQALVITTSLRALVRIPSTPHKPLDSSPDAPVGEESPEDAFLRRIWTLLKADIDGEQTAASDGLKLVNLADEVVRISKLYGGTLAGAPDAKCGEDEARLREAVDRTLKPTDPVFLLLQKRLVQALTAHLIAHTPKEKPNGVPVEMRTGRATKRPRMRLDVDEDRRGGVDLDFPKEVVSVKGFEHPVLGDAVSDVVARIRKCVAWTEFVWGDLFEGATDS